MTHHRHEETSSAVFALGALLVLLAAGVLYGAYRWVKRPGVSSIAASPADDDGGLVPADDEGGLAPAGKEGTGLKAVEPPFDNVLIDPETDAFVMVVEVPTPPTAAQAKRIARNVNACLSYDDDDYPEADGRLHIVRVLFHHPPKPEVTALLPGKRIQIWVYGPDGKQHPLTAADGMAPGQAEVKPPKSPVSIDMVLENPATGAVVLVLVQDEPWTKDTTLGVVSRTGAYVGAVRSGALSEQIAEGQAVEIQVHCRHRPDARALETLRNLRDAVAEDKIAFRMMLVGVGAEEEIDLQTPDNPAPGEGR